ncbi:MAG: DEAD/DEAH box helicase [Desulfurococcaceae archaeon]
MIVIKTTRWLDDREFRELLKIADYKGYESNQAVFIFNMDKALRNNYSYEDVILMIQDLNIEIDDSSLEELRKLFNNMSISINWNSSNGYVKISIPWSIYSRVRELLRKHQARYIGKNSKEIDYILTPDKLHSFVDEATSSGLNIIDRDKLLEEKNLPVKPNLRNVSLRYYQREAVDKWIQNNYRGIIALPTGSGKTIVGIAAVVEKPVRTLIVTYTREQMFQWRDMFIKYTDIDPKFIGLMYSEEKRLAPITITTYQSGFRSINEISPFFNLLVIDEVHHLPADKFRYIARHSIAKYKMGLSATPIREDGKHEELFPLLGGIIYYKTPDELVEQGYLSRYRIITVKVSLTPEERKIFEELRKKYRALVGETSFQEVLETARKGDSKAVEALRIHSKMKMLLAKSYSKINKAVEIARNEYENGNKVIVFTQYIEQANEISKRLNALLLTGEIPVDTRKNILTRFKESERGILVVTTVGDEGLDIPDANIGIIVSGTGSRRQFIQRLGRLLRPKKNSVEAKLYEIVLEKTPEEYLARKRKRLELE